MIYGCDVTTKQFLVVSSQPIFYLGGVIYG